VLPRAGSSGLLSLTDARDVPGQLIDSTNFSFAPVGAFNLVGDRTDSGTVAAVDGDMFELDYLVPAGAHGTFDLAFLFSPPNFPDTEVQDGLGLPLDTTFINGSIEVQIPEPAIGLLVLTVVSVRGVRHRHRGQGSAPIVV
jgi:hypothetical protein